MTDKLNEIKRVLEENPGSNLKFDKEDIRYLIERVENYEKEKHDCDFVEKHVNALEDVINYQEKIIKAIAAIHKIEMVETEEHITYPNLVESVEQTFLVAEELQEENESLKAKVEELEKFQSEENTELEMQVVKLQEENEKLKKVVEAAKNCQEYLRLSSEVVCAPAIYRTAAQQMRYDADQLERRDEAIRIFNTVLKELEGES